MSTPANLPSIEEVVAAVAPKSAQVDAPGKPEAPQEHEGGHQQDPKSVESDKNLSEKDGGKEGEAPKPAKPEAKPDPTASRFSALARKEKEARAAAAEVERKAKELEAREKLWSEREAASAKSRQDPIGFLKAHGLSLQDIVNAQYGRYQAPEPDPVDEKIRPHTEKIDQTAKTVQELTEKLARMEAEKAEAEQRRQYDEVMGGLKGAAEQDPEKFQFFNAFGQDALDLARDVMVEYWRQHERMLDFSEACELVEKHYEDNYLERLSAVNKLKSKITPASVPDKPAPKGSTQPPKEAEKPNTLSNRLQTASQANVDLDKLPKEQAIEYLAKKIKYHQS